MSNDRRLRGTTAKTLHQFKPLAPSFKQIQKNLGMFLPTKTRVRHALTASSNASIDKTQLHKRAKHSHKISWVQKQKQLHFLCAIMPNLTVPILFGKGYGGGTRRLPYNILQSIISDIQNELKKPKTENHEALVMVN